MELEEFPDGISVEVFKENSGRNPQMVFMDKLLDGILEKKSHLNLPEEFSDKVTGGALQMEFLAEFLLKLLEYYLGEDSGGILR